LRIIKIKPGSWLENKFLNLLKRNEVKMDLVIKRSCELTGEQHDEYLLSEGLYRIIGTEFESFRA
jgi:hypothetical protein